MCLPTGRNMVKCRYYEKRAQMGKSMNRFLLIVLKIVTVLAYLTGLGCFGGLSAFWGGAPSKQSPEAVATMRMWLIIGFFGSALIAVVCSTLIKRLSSRG